MAKKTPKPKPPNRPSARPASAPPRSAPSRSATGAGSGSGGGKKPSPAAVDAELARVDRELVKLINRRAALTLKQIQLSPRPEKARFAPLADNSWEELVSKPGVGPLGPVELRAVFRELVAGARKLVKGTRVAYLGPEYSFTHLAAIERFGTSAVFVPVSNIAAVFEEVSRHRADFGITPIENSTDGRIVDTLDMFTRLPLKICGEVQLAIHHNLLASCQRSEVSEIYSKPQALSQCREWLSRNMPQARLVEVTSTSTAAQLARDKPGAAAVASRQAGVQYDLQITAANIEDNPGNVTRFAIIGDEVTRPTGRDKTAVLLQIPHQPGALAEALGAFKRNGVNLSWIESFPLRGPEPGYVFFLDFEGHAGDARSRKTLAELQKHAVRLEVLGSYPRSEPLE